MIDKLDIIDEYSVKCDFILNTVTFIDAALNISLFFLKRYKHVMFYDFIYLAKRFRMRPKVRSTLNIPKHNWILLNQHSNQHPRCCLKQDCGKTRIDCTKINLVGITKGTLLPDSTLCRRVLRMNHNFVLSVFLIMYVYVYVVMVNNLHLLKLL